MNPKPLCIASSLAAFMIACAVEGGELSAGQAMLILSPVSVLCIWSFMQTNWYDPVKGGEQDDYNQRVCGKSESRDCRNQADQKSA